MKYASEKGEAALLLSLGTGQSREQGRFGQGGIRLLSWAQRHITETRSARMATLNQAKRTMLCTFGSPSRSRGCMVAAPACLKSSSAIAGKYSRGREKGRRSCQRPGGRSGWRSRITRNGKIHSVTERRYRDSGRRIQVAQVYLSNLRDNIRQNQRVLRNLLVQQQSQRGNEEGHRSVCREAREICQAAAE